MSTATSTIELSAPAESTHRPAPLGSRALLSIAWLLGGLVLGGALILFAYHLADTTDPSQGYTVCFFTGVACLFAPATWYCLRGNTAQRDIALLAVAIASYVPDFLREPSRVYLGDEFAHFQQASTMYRTGHLFAANQLVPEAGKYPGFELVVNTVREMTGLSTYRSGTVLILLLHVVTVIAVYEIARGVATDKWAALAAVIFAISPQFVAFDSLFSYETLGVPLFAGGLAVACRASREPTTHVRRILLGCAGAIAFLAIVTHHVSSFALLGGLFLVAIGWIVSPERDAGRSDAVVLLVIAAVGAVVATTWALLVGAHLGQYLLTEPENGIRTLYDRLTHAHGGVQVSSGYQPLTVVRSPLSGAGKPTYELVAAALTPPVAAVLSGIALWSRRRLWTPTWLLLAALALSYIILLPFLFAASAQAIVHRSWAFNYVGLAGLCAVGAESVVRRAARRSHWKLPALPGGGLAIPPVTAFVIPLLLAISAYGVGASVTSTFPGRLVLESDGRDTPNEAFALASWFESHAGRGKVVLTDNRTGQVIAGVADEKLDPSLAAQLILASGPISGPFRQKIQAQARYVVLNADLLKDTSSAGFYIWQYEPFVDEPLPPVYFDRLLALPWLKVVHRTPTYTVLEVMA